MAKIRKCNSCGYEWASETFYDQTYETICPSCGQAVPGDSIAKGVGI